MDERRKVVEAVKRLGAAVLVGDVRCDTPGHNTNFASYTVMNSDGDGHRGTGRSSP